MPKKSNKSKKAKRERWYKEHPGITRKEFAKQKKDKRLDKKGRQVKIN